MDTVCHSPGCPNALSSVGFVQEISNLRSVYTQHEFGVLRPNLHHTAKTEALQLVSYNQILCRTTKFCVVQPNFVSYNRIFCRTTEFCVVQPNFVLYNRILCCTTKFCVVQPNFVSCNQILCRTTKFCVLQPNFVSYNRILRFLRTYL
jgi:hypothetical protein